MSVLIRFFVKRLARIGKATSILDRAARRLKRRCVGSVGSIFLGWLIDNKIYEDLSLI